MTEHDPGHDPEHEGVRRLLAELPDPGPLPAGVAARLDDRLAALVAERAAAPAEEQPAGSEVRDLSAARARRRRLRTGLVAAASVAVLGIGLGTVADDLLPGGGGPESATTADAGGDSMLREAAPDAPTRPDGGAETQREDDQDGETFGGEAAEVRRSPIRSATLDEDLARIAARPGSEGVLGDDARGAASSLAPCAVPTLAEGDEARPVRFDGDPATLVLRAPSGGTREAQVYTCDTGDALLAQGTVPAR
jgi:hypothetical protein